MKKEMSTAYEASLFENDIYENWVNNDKFHAKVTDKESYFIPMPPPNATGKLHLGHATMIALQDIMIRHAKMNGKETMWLPGTDHAAIATQSVVEKKLQSEGMEKPRAELGREALISEIKKFVEQSKANIKNQVQKMGAACDWKREKYTLDEDMNHAVNTFFGMMMEDGLIYRGGRTVNWDPNMQTTVADDELEYVDEKTKFYHFKFGPFTCGTARLETKFGDKYVVMHPDDERYSEYKHGDTFECEWINGKITATVIKDEAVDPSFGTGVMTITPWHSQVDFEIAQRHNLDVEQIIDFEGNLNEKAGEFAGMNIFDAREPLAKKLSEKGLIVKVDENYEHRVAVNYRGKGMIEPQIMKQWFIDVNKQVIEWKGKTLSIKEVLQDVVRSKMVELVPSRFEKIYFNWIDNLRDWCISRQIWWGHQIPIWYKASPDQLDALSKKKDISSFNLSLMGVGDEYKFGVEPPEEEGWIRDPDTLDTWFSSGLWPFATLGWPEKTDELNYFMPAAVLETGYDILFFWVARMILASTYAMRKSGFLEEKSIPFKTVYLHGLIRDRFGKKMSKSRPETCIDPLDMIEKYGADALRLSLVIGSTPGNDLSLYEEKIAGYRNFVNKIWNASRFVLLNVDDLNAGGDFSKNDIKSDADKWIMTEFMELIEKVNGDFANYRYSDAGMSLYEFLWKTLCDWYLEISKGNVNPKVLLFVMKGILKMLHPFVPYVTEVIWSHLAEGSIFDESWPEYSTDFVFENESKNIVTVNSVISLLEVLEQSLRLIH